MKKIGPDFEKDLWFREKSFLKSWLGSELPLTIFSVVNLDPAAEYFAYNPDVDIRELISIEDVMEDEDLRLGPNGGLVFCMEHLVENFDWLEEAMDPHDDDYFLIGRANK